MNESGVPDALRSGSPALLKRYVALSMKKWRLECGLNQKDAATRIGRTIQHISNLESGRLPTPSDLELLLDLYGKADQLPPVRELVVAARKARNWWADLSVTIPKWFELFLGLEVGAARLGSFDTVVVPDLLQTRAYASAVIEGNPDLTPSEVEQLVELRMGRQRIFDRETGPAELRTVLDESVLHRVRGDRTVMREQFEHLLAMSDRPGIEVRVLPYTAGANPAQDRGTFVVMDFPPEMDGDPGLVHLELLTGGYYVEKPEEIAEYRRALTRLQALAADPEASRAIIEKAVKEI